MTTKKLAPASVEIQTADLKWLCSAVLPAVSRDEVTPMICGAVLSAEGGVLKALATDRYRVHRATSKVEGLKLEPFYVSRRMLQWIRTVSFTDSMHPGNFPGVERLIDAAEAAEPVADLGGGVNVDLFRGTAALAGYRGEMARITNIRSSPEKPGQVLVHYKNGVALVQGSVLA